jgi:tRNA dimethylallyltransferase
MNEKKPKAIAILGTTASGKSGLAVRLAKRFDGEVISADSRQVYRGLDIGTEKTTAEEMDGIPHYLIDIADVGETFSAADFKRQAETSIDDILRRQKLPIIAGGTGFYTRILLENIDLPEVPPDESLRRDLDGQTNEELYEKLLALDPRRAGEIDRHNPRRLIRAIEIACAFGAVPNVSKKMPRFDSLRIGLAVPDDVVKERITQRLTAALKRGLVEETRSLHEEKNISWDRIDELGLEYRIVAGFLRGEIPENELQDRLIESVWHYAKRQKTWLKKEPAICWFAPEQWEEIVQAVDEFLQQ